MKFREFTVQLPHETPANRSRIRIVESGDIPPIPRLEVCAGRNYAGEDLWLPVTHLEAQGHRISA